MEANSGLIRFFPATNGVLLDARGRVLLTRRSAKVRAPGYWCLPGGHLDPGETWLDGCRRELREELGVEVGEAQLLGIYSDPDTNVVDHPAAPGGKGQFLTAVFLFRDFSPAFAPNDEVDAWEWFDPAAPPEPLIRSHHVRLTDAQSFAGRSFFR